VTTSPESRSKKGAFRSVGETAVIGAVNGSGTATNNQAEYMALIDGLRKAGVTGEVIIVDSSTDRSPEIAEERGARLADINRLPPDDACATAPIEPSH